MAFSTGYKTGYSSFANDYNDYFRGFRYSNPYRHSLGSSKELEEMYRKQFVSTYIDANKKRSLLDRGFDTLLFPLYGVAGFAKGVVDGGSESDISPFQGLWEGIRAGNPFGEGYEKGEYTFSQVLESAGWKPTSTAGKVARGMLGFGLDVALDPTTYLSGGLSAVIKGTGKAGVKASHVMPYANKIIKDYGIDMTNKTLKDLPDEVFKRELKLLNFRKPEDSLANKFEALKKAKIVQDVVEGNGLTVGRATEIIKSQAKARGLKLTEQELIRDAKLLSDEFNRVIGLRTNAKDVTLSLGNLPFGNKIFGSLADKKITIAKASKAQEFGEKTVAPYYAKLRDSIYGSKLGEMFRPSTPLYRASKEDPAKLYDYLKSIEITRGLNMDKIMAEKLIREKGEELLGLTPSENKQVLELMQDKTIWAPITEKIKLLDTKEAKIYKRQIVKAKTDTQAKYNALKQKKKTIESLIKANEDGLLDAQDVLKTLKEEYREELGKIDLKSIENKKDVIEIIKKYENEIKAIDGEIDKVSSKISVDDIVKKFDEYVEQSKKLKNIIEKRKVVKEKKPDIVKEIERVVLDYIKTNPKAGSKNIAKALGITEYKVRTVLENNKLNKYVDREDWVNRSRLTPDEMIEIKVDKLREEAVRLSKVIEKTKDNVDVRTIQNELIEMLSRYIYRVPGQISTTIYPQHIDELVNMVKTGKKPEQIIKHINKNPDNYTGLSQVKYSFIGDRIGYGRGNKDFKNWQQFYKNRMQPLDEKVFSAMKENKQIRLEDVLTDAEFNMYKYLQQKNYEREKLKAIFAKAHTSEDVMKIISDMIDDTKSINDEIFDAASKSRYSLVQEERGQILETQKELKKRLAKNSSGDTREINKNVIGTKVVNTKNVETILDNINIQTIKYNKNKIKELQKGLKKFPHKKDELLKEINMRRKKLSRLKNVKWKNINNKTDSKYLEVPMEERKDMVNRIIEKIIAKKEKVPFEKLSKTKGEFKLDISPEDMKWINLAIHEVKQLCNVNKTRYINLSNKDKAKYIEQAINNAVARVNGKELIGGVGEHEANKLRKQKEKEMELYRQVFNKSRIREGVEVEILVEGKLKRAIVNKIDNKLIKKDGSGYVATRYQVTDKDGNVHNLKLKDIMKVKGYTEETALHTSKAARDLIERKNELLRKIGQEKEVLTSKGNSEKVIKEFEDKIRKVENHIVWFEKKKIQLNNEINNHSIKTDELFKAMEKYDEILTNDDAFISFVKLNEKKMYDDASSRVIDTGKIVLDDMPVGEKVKEVVKSLRAEFAAIGAEEVKIGKLSKEKFEFMRDKYLTRILTDEGESLVDRMRSGRVRITEGFGYGEKYNPFSKSSKTKQYTIEEVNEYMAPHLKGKDFFSESIANIYITRALKHEELMYDDKYMHNMMKIFGDEIVDGVVKEGYKPVINFGMAKEFVRDMGSFRLSYIISEHLGKHLTSNKYFFNLRDELKNKYIKDYMKAMWSEEKITMKYAEIHEEIMSQTKLARSLGEYATPMLELEKHQINGMNNIFARYKDDYNKLVKERESSALKYENYKALEKIEETFKKIARLKAPQIVQVNDAIVQKANQARKIQINRDHNRLLDLYDKFTHFVKLNQTVVVPAFHTRNKMSNMFNNFLQIGRDAVSVKNQSDVYKVIRSDGKARLDKVIYKDGTAHSWEEILVLAKRYGVVNEGYFAKDIGAGSASLGFRGSKYDPTNTKGFVLYKAGTAVGSTIENMDRLIHFMSQLKNGMKPEQAAKSVEKFLFDYSDLTAFEANVMKRIMPYYTWLRKNSSLQVKQMIDKPEIYQRVAKIMHGIEGANNRDDMLDERFINDFANDWVQTPFKITNKKGREERVLWNPNMPFMDLSRIPNPLDPVGSTMELFTQTNPAIKVPIEQLANRNVFFDEPIVKEGEGQVGNRINHILSNMAMYNVSKDMVNKKDVDLGLQILNTLTGVKMLSYDYDIYKNMKIKEKLKEQLNVKTIKSLRKDGYIKEGKEEREVRKRIEKLIENLFVE